MARPRKYPSELLAMVNRVYERDKALACVDERPHTVTVATVARRFALPAVALWSYRNGKNAGVRKKIFCSRPNGVPEKEVSTQEGTTTTARTASGRRETEAEPTGTAALQS